MQHLARKPATLRAVADAAGVHPSTASRALSSDARHLVAKEVAERVQAAARALGYRRDTLAAGLRTRRSRLVGVVVPDIANPVFGPILSGIEAELAGQGYSALVANGGPDAASQLATVEHLVGRQVEGLVLATARRDDPVVTFCLSAGVPTVLVNRAETEARTAAVVSDDGLGMRLAVEHLVGLGHRRVGHLAGPHHISTGALRREGFEAAARAAGIWSPSAVEEARGYTREAGCTAAHALLDRYAPTAIAAANDLLALGAYQALTARGLSCPRDVSVVGHNDMPLVDMVAPPLTTIRIRHVEMGREAARLLLDRISLPGGRPQRTVTKPTLVVRSSTAPPPVTP